MGNQAEDVTVERKRGVEVGDRNANVGNTRCLGHRFSGHKTKTDAVERQRPAKVIGDPAPGQGS
jgi:hypothetical protein